MYLAIEAGLEIIPVLNKIDLKGAKPEQVSEQIQNLYPVEDDGILKVCIQEKRRSRCKPLRLFFLMSSHFLIIF